MEWRMAEAKNRLSEVLNLVSSVGPQRVRRRQDAYVVMREEDYERLAGRTMSFKAFLMQPAGLDELDLARDPSPMRDVKL